MLRFYVLFMLNQRRIRKNLRKLRYNFVNAAINLNVKDAAREFIHHGEIKPGLLNRIEMVIRAYDPCIKCATRLDGKGLRVEIRDNKGSLLKIL